MIRSKPLPPQAYLRSIFDYAPETGVFTWKPRSDFARPQTRDSWNAKYAGKAAGYRLGEGHILISVNGGHYTAHRLAWKWVYGSDPSGEIDHVNGVRHDNRLANLREATRRQNQMNKKGHSRKGLPKGVYMQKGRYVARIFTDGRHRYVGMFATAEAAGQAYREAAKRHFGEYAYRG